MERTRTFALHWLGSQAPICHSVKAVCASELQQKTALLIAEPNWRAVRVMCGMPPNRVCLTPLLFASEHLEVMANRKKLRDAWVQVWNMPPGQVVPVYVSKHSPVCVLVNQIAMTEGMSFDEFARLSDNLRSRFDVGRAALLHSSWSFNFVWNTLHASLKYNRAFATSVFSCIAGCENFHFALEWHKDREMVLFVVTRDCFSASMAYRLYLKVGSFQNDKDVLLAFVAKNGLVLRCAPNKLKQDKGVVLTAVRQNGIALDHAPAELKQDKDFVLAAVTNCGLALQCAADTLKGDKDVVLAAVKSCGRALKYAAQDLQQDLDVLKATCYSK